MARKEDSSLEDNGMSPGTGGGPSPDDEYSSAKESPCTLCLPNLELFINKLPIVPVGNGVTEYGRRGVWDQRAAAVPPSGQGAAASGLGKSVHFPTPRSEIVIERETKGGGWLGGARPAKDKEGAETTSTRVAQQSQERPWRTQQLLLANPGRGPPESQTRQLVEPEARRGWLVR